MKLRVRVNSINALREELECTVLESDSPDVMKGRTVCVDPFINNLIKKEEVKNLVGKEIVIDAIPYSVIAKSIAYIEYPYGIKRDVCTDPETLDNTVQ